MITGIEGVRRSDEDFVKYKKGIQREVEVRKAAFANLHGGIVRRLTGLGSVSTRLLQEVWDAQGKGKKTSHCAKGKGYGSTSERLGEDKHAADYGPAPACPKCKKTMVFREGRDGREPFWGCPDYKTCGQKPITAKKVSQNGPQSTQEPAGREPGDEPASEHVEKLGEKKNRLGDLLKASKLPDARKQELRAAIIGAKSVEELTDVEAAIGEA
jgi:hypothetical protein